MMGTSQANLSQQADPLDAHQEGELLQGEFELLCENLRKSVRNFALFEAFYLRGIPQKILADKLGLSERTLRKRLSQVRKDIRRLILDQKQLPSNSKRKLT